MSKPPPPPRASLTRRPGSWLSGLFTLGRSGFAPAGNTAHPRPGVEPSRPPYAPPAAGAPAARHAGGAPATRTAESATQPDAYATLLSTVEALAGQDEPNLWPKLLASAIGVIPGAEAGSIHLRRGDEFVFVAQQGFSEDLLGVATPEAAAEIWHGDPDAWRRGEPRIARAAQLAAHAGRQTNLGFDTAADLTRVGRAAEILANLCLPIVLGGRVAAHLNLDAFTTEEAFTAASVAEARQYALQATALLAASRERAELQARSREFEVLEAVAHALRTADSTGVIASRLADEAVRLVSCPHAALLLRGPGGRNLRVTTGRGLFTRWCGQDVPPGTGLSWAALNAREVLRSDDVTADPRAYSPFGFGPGGYSQLTAPLFTAAGEPLGVLIAARDRRDAFTALDARLIGLMADVGATAIERLQTADRLEQQARESTALLALSRILETEDTPAAGLEHLRRLANADVAVYATLRGGTFTPTAQAGTPGPALASLISAGLRFEPNPTGRPTFRERRSGYQVTALDDHPHAALLVEAGVECAYFTLLQTEGVPGGLALFRAQRHAPSVRLQGDVNGTVELPPSEQPRAFGWTDAELRLLEAAARTLGAVAARSERVNNLEAAHEGALRAIGLALEARDHETGGHTDRVATLADRLGEKLGLDPAQRKALRWGAYLHDVGKLGIPDAILLKPGELSGPERAIMRTHPSQGFELTLSLPFLPETARAVVLHHHERWDGQGYPAGLSGRHTPLAARIFAVCDVFDALISVRPYKPAMPESEAREEIRRAVLQGQFDPEVVAAFEALFEDAPGHTATDLYPTASA